MDAQVMRWRADTPAAAAGLIHLNNAGAGLMPTPVLEAMTEHLRREVAHGGYEAADLAAPQIESAYAGLARLLSAQPRNVAIVENATAAFAQALSAFDLRRGDVIVTSRNDYISNQLMYLSLQRRSGVEFVRAEDLPEGGIDPQSLREILRRRRPTLVAVTWVPTNSGLVQDVEAVGRVCEDAGVPYLLDACQAAGQIPIDVDALRCDFLSGTARKFLRGPRGIGFLYVADRVLDSGAHPLYLDMRGARWTDENAFRLADSAHRFENWEFSYALVLGFAEAVLYALEVGVEEGGRRAHELAAYARQKLSEIDGLRVLDRGRELCAIVTVEVTGVPATDAVAQLREWGINTSATFREWAVLDMAEKHAESAVRLSPHYYNTVAEIDSAVAALRGMAG